MKNLKKTSFLGLVILYLGMTMFSHAMPKEFDDQKCGFVYGECTCYPYEK